MEHNQFELEYTKLVSAMKKENQDEFIRHYQLKAKNPVSVFGFSVFLGGLGVDRFIIGDTGLGIGKLLTAGGLGVWTIVDLFLIAKATRRKNMEIALDLKNVIK